MLAPAVGDFGKACCSLLGPSSAQAQGACRGKIDESLEQYEVAAHTHGCIESAKAVASAQGAAHTPHLQTLKARALEHPAAMASSKETGGHTRVDKSEQPFTSGKGRGKVKKKGRGRKGEMRKGTEEGDAESHTLQGDGWQMTDNLKGNVEEWKHNISAASPMLSRLLNSLAEFELKIVVERC
jgi:hypothetical protein